MQTILAIDDERSVRESYRMILGDSHRLLLADNGVEGLRVFDEKHVDLILLDLSMPEMTGMAFLAELERRGETTPVVVVSGSNSVHSAVDAMKHGARDFLVKPFDVDDLTRLINKLLTEVRMRRELAALREQGETGIANIVGQSPALRATIAKAQLAMRVDSTVLITGPTGCGKDVIARAIHHGSPRKHKPFVPISCCAIPSNLIESELFGHVKGAFTGASDNRIGKMQVADGGTLFLDELGEMPMEAQAKLLRVLQDGCFYPVGGNKQIEVDVRFVCATNRDLSKAIAQGLFREDLYYRVNVLPVETPSLAQRREDIPLLVAHFVAKHGPRVNATTAGFTPKAIARLSAYDWPGNIRELENTVERILVCHGQEAMIGPEQLEGLLPGARKATAEGLSDLDGLPLEEATQRLERHLILRALERCNFVQSQAADVLGTTRRILKYKMDQLGIAGDEPESMAS
jgi:DNA-binding NtrC family response regulator